MEEDIRRGKRLVADNVDCGSEPGAEFAGKWAAGGKGSSPGIRGNGKNVIETYLDGSSPVHNGTANRIEGRGVHGLVAHTGAT